MAKSMTWGERYDRYFQFYGYFLRAARPGETRRYCIYCARDPFVGMARTLDDRLYFIGKAGAVLFSASGKVSDATSMTDTIKRRVAKLEQEQGWSTSR